MQTCDLQPVLSPSVLPDALLLPCALGVDHTCVYADVFAVALD